MKGIKAVLVGVVLVSVGAQGMEITGRARNRSGGEFLMTNVACDTGRGADAG